MDRVSEKCKGLLHPARPVLENDALEVLEADVRKHLLGLCVDGDGRGVQAGVLRHPVVPLLALLLLELEGDTADRALLNTPHEVGDVASDLVAHLLGGKISTFTDRLCVSHTLYSLLSCCSRSPEQASGSTSPQ